MDYCLLVFGEIMCWVKNSFGLDDNCCCFMLIGDFVFCIVLLYYCIVMDSVNYFDLGVQLDMVCVFSYLIIKGYFEDYLGNVFIGFNGVFLLMVFDKEKVVYILGQELLLVFGFEICNNVFYKGKVMVFNGWFFFSCIVLKDINYVYGRGKISYYVNFVLDDGDGQDFCIIIGGIDINVIVDVVGLVIEFYFNDDKFVNGSIIGKILLLVVKCLDELGINIVGNGVGYDFIVVFDGKIFELIVFNNYYIGDVDFY